MTDLRTALDGLNIPKQLIDLTAAFLDRLLGPSVDETAILLADKVRARRVRNQVTVLSRSRGLLVSAGLEPSQVNLRTLAPLLEKASLEEDPAIQEMWATLLANAATSSDRQSLRMACIEILGGISPLEAAILLFIHDDYRSRRESLLAELSKWTKRAEPFASRFFYRPEDLLKHVGLAGDRGDFLIDNLMRLGVIRFDVPEINDGELEDPSFVHLTELGLKMLKECNEPPAATHRG